MRPRPHRPPSLSTQARELDSLLSDVVDTFGAQSQEQVCCHDITWSEYRAMRHLETGPASTMLDLVRALAVTKSGATRVVDRLEQKGYAHRETGELDARSCCVRLSPKGTALLRKIEAEVLPAREELLSRISGEERITVLTALRMLLTAVGKASDG